MEPRAAIRVAVLRKVFSDMASTNVKIDLAYQQLQLQHKL